MNLLKTFTVAICALSMTLGAAAAGPVKGLWTKTPVSRPSSVTQIVESPTAVWYLGGGTLHRYDRATGEVSLHGLDQGLNAEYSTLISYNPTEGYLVAAMLDGLLNIIHDDGTVVQVNDIAKVRSTRTADIQDVTFKGDDLYVATNFGIAVVDAKTGHLKYTGVYPSLTSGTVGVSGGPSHVTVVGDWIYAVWDPYIYGAPLSADLSTPDAWSKFTDTDGNPLFDASRLNVERTSKIFPLNAESLIVEDLTGEWSLGYTYFILTPDTANKTYAKTQIARPARQRFQRAWMGGDNLYVTFNPYGSSGINIYEYTAPESIAQEGSAAGSKATSKNQIFDTTSPMCTAMSASNYSPTVWLATEKGLAGYEFAADGTRTMTVTPEQTGYKGAHTTVANISMLRPTPDGKGLLMTTRSDTNLYMENAGHCYNPDGNAVVPVMSLYTTGTHGYLTYTPSSLFITTEPSFFVPGYVNALVDGKVTDYSPELALTKGNSLTPTSANAWPETVYYTQASLQQPILAPNGIAANPKSSTLDIFVNTNEEGLYRLRYNESGELEQTIYSNRLETLLCGGWNNQGKDVRFDDEGNLWVVGTDTWSATSIRDGNRKRTLTMLPAEKVASNDFHTNNWIEPACVPAKGTWTVKVDAQLWMINTDHGKYMAVNPQRGVGTMLIYKRNGTGADTSTDQAWLVTTLYTQFGEKISLGSTNALYADSKGRLWIQTDRFFGYVKDFSTLTDGSKELNAVRVCNGTITDLSAGGVLAGEQMVAMSEAPDGTIWIATQTSGLYQVSADGTQVLDHYDTNNSPLPSDKLGAVCVLADGSVNVGTRHGLYTLMPGKAPAAADLDNVTVTPSPAATAYTGHFTISNLTADAPVRVTTDPDPAKGKTLFDSTASGGAIVWDGITADGSRVAPGTYHVHAGTPLRPVAKIVVIE